MTPLLFPLFLFLGQSPDPATTRQEFLKLLDRPRVDPRPKELGRETKDGTVRIRWEFISEERAGKDPERVPALLVRANSPW